jgi:prophage tail gpP-like protein
MTSLGSIVESVKSAMSLVDTEALDRVYLQVGSRLYANFTEINIRRSLNALAPTFTVSMTDEWRLMQADWQIAPGDPVMLRWRASPMMIGYLDSVDVSITNDERSVRLSGRARTADLIDSAAVHPSGQFKGQTIEAIATVLCAPFGITVTSELSTSTPFAEFAIDPGETVFETLHRAALIQGALLQTDVYGNLVIRNQLSSVPVSQMPVLQEGGNILRASARYDETDRFSTYTVIGQTKSNDLWNGPKTTTVTGVAKDPGVKRYRPLVVQAETSVTTLEAQKRAAWEATVKAAKSCVVSLTVQGWEKPGDGGMWNPGDQVIVRAPFIGIPASFLTVVDIELSRSVESGTLTNLTLSRADAFKPSPVVPPADPTKKLSSGGLWG